jgi:hypothetical protein
VLNVVCAARIVSKKRPRKKKIEKLWTL